MVYWIVLFHLEAPVSVLSIVFLVAVLLVALYGANALLLAGLYLYQQWAESRRSLPDHPNRPPEPKTWPTVTVQLPIYNELLVVHRLIDAVAQLDYPRDRLQIQVLDDSTDDTTSLARARVVHYQAQGLDISHLMRENRRDFKAGALAYGLEQARGEFIAVFDADFLPSADFLKDTIPHLVTEPSLGFVQTRWGHLNGDYSALTRAQTIALDGHFVVEHLGRNRCGLLMNFNGTAGVWRADAIQSAGGWQGDTLTEDVDLSFRAQLAGWQALYLPEVEAPAELPPSLLHSSGSKPGGPPEPLSAWSSWPDRCGEAASTIEGRRPVRGPTHHNGLGGPLDWRGSSTSASGWPIPCLWFSCS